VSIEMRTFVHPLLSPLLAVGIVHCQQKQTSDSPSEPSTPEAIKQFNDDQVAAISKANCRQGRPAALTKRTRAANP
jgi:hypothetical protein